MLSMVSNDSVETCFVFNQPLIIVGGSRLSAPLSSSACQTYGNQTSMVSFLIHLLVSQIFGVSEKHRSGLSGPRLVKNHDPTSQP